jgi:hypothetical protein
MLSFLIFIYRKIKKYGPIYKNKVNSILSPSLNPSGSAELVAGRQGREVILLPIDGGGRVGVKLNC